LVVLGLATMTRRNKVWRTYGIMALVCMGAFELYSFVYVDRHATGNVFFFDTADFYRRLAFTALAIALFFGGTGAGNRTQVEILKDIAFQQETLIARSRALSLQRSAVMRDSNLRRLYSEFYKRIEIESGIVYADKEYQEAKTKALLQMNVDQLMSETESFVGSVVENSFQMLGRERENAASATKRE